MTTTAPILNGGAPIWLQKHKVRVATRRPKIVRAVRCKLGLHNPPYDQFFEEYGSIMIGGVCTRCNDEALREVVWIGDVWDFMGKDMSFKDVVLYHLNYLLSS